MSETETASKPRAKMRQYFIGPDAHVIDVIESGKQIDKIDLNASSPERVWAERIEGAIRLHQLGRDKVDRSPPATKGPNNTVLAIAAVKTDMLVKAAFGGRKAPAEDIARLTAEGVAYARGLPDDAVRVLAKNAAVKMKLAAMTGVQESLDDMLAKMSPESEAATEQLAAD